MTNFTEINQIRMPSFLFAIFAFAFSNVACAEELNIGAIKAQGAQL